MKTSIIIIFLFLAGCATLPTNPNFEVKAGETVGIYIEIPENLTHTFIGMTIFNNFEKDYPIQWDLEAYAYKSISQSLKNAGFKVINLKETNVSYKNLKELLIVKDKKWFINPKNKDTFNTLQKLGVKSAIYFNTAKTVAYIQCGMSNCTDFYSKSYGLFTRSFLGIKSHTAIAAFDNGIIITNPLALMQFTNPKTFPLKNFKPKDFKNISETEWDTVKNEILMYIDDFSSQLPNLMKNNKQVLEAN